HRRTREAQEEAQTPEGEGERKEEKQAAPRETRPRNGSATINQPAGGGSKNPSLQQEMEKREEGERTRRGEGAETPQSRRNDPTGPEAHTPA
ncbi:hypothetical protein GDO81_029211, partial [Engystomops pustulosus]